MKFLEQVADKEDLKLYVDKQCDNTYCIEFEYWSGLGEDCFITLVVDELAEDKIIKAMFNSWDYFDVEEHAAELYNLHGEHGTPTSLRDLLDDAEEQEKKLEQIYNTMLDIKGNI